MRGSNSMAVFAAHFEVTTHLRSIFVVPALFGFLVQPDAGLPQVIVRQTIDVLVYFGLEVLGHLLPDCVV